MPHRFDAITEAELRQRQSAKWRHYPPDVLPAWVAEMDFPLADPVRDALRAAIDRDDCGYAYPTDLGNVFARWAGAHYGWTFEGRDVSVVADVMTGVAELISAATKPGDGIVIDPPVYPPFAATIRHLGRVVREAPLATDARGRLAIDVDAVERAYREGARMHLFCSPHNPSGRVHDRATLEKVAELAERYDVLVLSDEIHAPLTLPGATHVPFPMVSESGARRSIVLASASKAWNLAGLKAAFIVAVRDETREVVARLPPEAPYHAGHFGIIAAQAALTAGEPFLADVISICDRNRRLLLDLLNRDLPEVRYTPPDAGYLAWLDCRGLGLTRDPARLFLEHGRVALSAGPTFGTGGEGFARLNIATSRGLLEEAVRRMASAVKASRNP